jgi:hypothetical protein
MCDLKFGWRASIKGGFGVFKCVHNFQPFNEILPMFSKLKGQQCCLWLPI